MTDLQELKQALQSLADKTAAKHSQRFFKTAKGEYGEGDIFLGIRVPVLRKLALQYKQLSLSHIQSLLKSKFHEQRLLAIIMLVNKYKKADESEAEAIFTLYINNTKHINNWDLVDISAPNIIGVHLYKRNRELLYDFAKSTDLWKKRIAILATFHFIRNNDFKDCLKICELLLTDSHDLIHKATGWMLRETGKRHLQTEQAFLDEYAARMPRTMLRYALEKLPVSRRKYYMALKP